MKVFGGFWQTCKIITKAKKGKEKESCSKALSKADLNI
jgi:hypothetical protein